MPPVVSTPSLTVILIGAIVPLFTYALNRIKAYADLPEAVKAFVQVFAVAFWTGVYQAAAGHNLGFNRTTWGYIVTAVVSAMYAHGYLWKPADVNNTIGGDGVRDLTSEQRKALVLPPPAPQP